MRIDVKILLLWLALLIALRLLLLFPHADLHPIAIINVSVQILLCVLSFRIAKESSGKQKFIYINFTALFAFGVFLMANSFIGHSLFSEHIYANLYFRIYVNKFGMDFIWLFTFIYIAIDFFCMSWRTITKYLSSFSITACIVIPLFFPFLSNPFQLYHEKDYVNIKAMEKNSQEFHHQFHREPDDYELAQSIMTHKTTVEKNEVETTIKTVRDLRPYQRERGTTPIFWKPLDMIFIYTNIIALILIASILLFTYKQSKAYGAYFDKILIILFLISAVEILHVYSFINSYSMEQYLLIFKLGQYITISILLLMVYAFDLKLKFVLSTAGKYYEETLDNNPEKVTRWKDEIDNLILITFSKKSNPHKLIGYTDSQTINKEDTP